MSRCDGCIFDDSLDCNDFDCEELETLIREHDKQIRADVMDETFISLLNMFRDGYDYPNQDIKDLCIFLLEDAIETIRGV